MLKRQRFSDRDWATLWHTPQNHLVFLGIAGKQDELKRGFKHPVPFSSPDSATPCFSVLDDGVNG
jgi:hypothetical protein